MTEKQYIRATNRAKVGATLAVFRDVLPGDDYGITDAEFDEIVDLLEQAQIKLFASYQIEAEKVSK